VYCSPARMQEDTLARFEGRVVIIGGAARGQGAAEARPPVAEGAKVVIGDVLEAGGRRLASEPGCSAAFIRQDVTEETDWIKADRRRYIAARATDKAIEP
jgi:3alpha(or 20beta)-hydroxysteroid dehydrogenase